MRNAWFGINALIILLFNSLVVLLHFLEVFPYFYTLFYPLFCLMSLLISIVGVAEKDKNKTYAWIAIALSAGLLIHWLVALLIRVNAI